MRRLVLLFLIIPICAYASIESDFIAVREAFKAKNSEQLNQLAKKLSHTSIEPYITAYQLSLNKAQADLLAINRFLARDQESPAINQFRIDWLKFLAKENRWQEFANEYHRLVRSDDELDCYILQWQLIQNTQQIEQKIRKTWLTGQDLPNSCTPVFSEARARGIISDVDIWQRIRLALEANKVSLARYLARQLPKTQAFDEAEFTAAASNPNSYLSKTDFTHASQGKRMAGLFALQRVARSSVQQAHDHWQKITQHFTEEETHYFFAWLGFYAAMQHDHRAVAWFDLASNDTLNAKQFTWRVRAALRSQNWHAVWASIDNMPTEQQAEDVWQYWKARALKALGRTALANTLFHELSHKFNYHGQLAAEEIGMSADAIPTQQYRINPQELSTLEKQANIQRAFLLFRTDMRLEGLREWNWAIRDFDDHQLLVAAELARQQGYYDRAIYSADRTKQLHDFTLRYPTPYRNALQENVRAHNLEEAWVFGLMRQESRFIATIKSAVGATGLMQLMPDTAQWVAKRIGMNNYKKTLIHEVDINLKLGTYYMRNVADQLDNSPVLASAAYNAGPGRARKWRGEQTLEGAIYIETIPFDETRDYVQKVMSNTLYYAKLLSHPNRPLKQRLGIIQPRKVTTMSETG